MESITTVEGSTMPGITLDELWMAEEEDCSTFLLDDEALTLELDFAELLLFTELLLNDFFVVVEDDDLTMLDDDSSKDGSTELLSSPQAAKKSPIQTETQKTSLFILRNIQKIPARVSREKATPAQRPG